MGSNIDTSHTDSVLADIKVAVSFFFLMLFNSTIGFAGLFLWLLIILRFQCYVPAGSISHCFKLQKRPML